MQELDMQYESTGSTFGVRVNPLESALVSYELAFAGVAGGGPENGKVGVSIREINWTEKREEYHNIYFNIRDGVQSKTVGGTMKKNLVLTVNMVENSFIVMGITIGRDGEELSRAYGYFPEDYSIWWQQDYCSKCRKLNW